MVLINQGGRTRGIKFDPNDVDAGNDAVVYVGGIDLFRSSDSGTNWSQISKWSDNNLAALDVSKVHADQHSMVFRPRSGNANKVVFGTDGGIFYSDEITAISGLPSPNITSRNKDYNTVQFYYGTIDPVVAGGDGDDLAGGTRDNGTQFVLDASAGANNFFDPVGVDGGYTEIDNGGSYMIQSYTGNDHRFANYPMFNTFYMVSSGTGGSFINIAELDKNLDILYSNEDTNTIERNSNITAGSSMAVVRTFLTNSLLNSDPTAYKVSTFTAGSTKLFVGLTNGRLLRLDNADGASTWNSITGGGFLGSISDIEFGQDETEIFVTIHNYGVTSIWFTTDGGANLDE